MNDEAQMTKSEGIPNAQMTNAKIYGAEGPSFVIPSSFVLRHSSFLA
jgi:hypothetical protein